MPLFCRFHAKFHTFVFKGVQKYSWPPLKSPYETSRGMLLLAYFSSPENPVDAQEREPGEWRSGGEKKA